MKRTKNLIILLVILVFAVAIYVVASFVAKSEEKKNETPEETEITLVKKDVADIVSVAVASEKTSYLIELKSNAYKLADKDDFPLDQTVASNIVETVSSVVSTRLVAEDIGDVSEYGLDEPKYSISIVYSDGSKTEIKLGDYHKHADAYYLILNGESKIYLIDADFADGVSYTEKQLLKDETITPPEDGFDCVNEIEVSFSDGSGHKYTYVPAEENESAETTGDGTSADSEASHGSWIKALTDGTVAEGDFSEEAEKVFTEFYSYRPSDWADYCADSEDELDKYGLKTPYAKITVRFEVTEDGDDEITVKTEQSFIIGDTLPDTDADGEKESTADRYFKIGDGKVVYIISESDFETALGLESKN